MESVEKGIFPLMEGGWTQVKSGCGAVNWRYLRLDSVRPRAAGQRVSNPVTLVKRVKRERIRLEKRNVRREGWGGGDAIGRIERAEEELEVEDRRICRERPPRYGHNRCVWKYVQSLVVSTKSSLHDTQAPAPTLRNGKVDRSRAGSNAEAASHMA